MAISNPLVPTYNPWERTLPSQPSMRIAQPKSAVPTKETVSAVTPKPTVSLAGTMIQPTTTTAPSAVTPSKATVGSPVGERTLGVQNSVLQSYKNLLKEATTIAFDQGPKPADILSQYAQAGVPLTQASTIGAAVQADTRSRAAMIGRIYDSTMETIQAKQKADAEYAQMLINSFANTAPTFLPSLAPEEFQALKEGQITPEMQIKLKQAQELAKKSLSTEKPMTQVMEDASGKKVLYERDPATGEWKVAIGTGIGGIDTSAFTDIRSTYGSERSSRVLQSVDNLLEIAKKSPGIFGRTAAMDISDFWRTDDFRNYKAMSDTLAAGIGFTELNEMREASKTGGALGQVSERELALLESSLGSLRMDQSPEQVISQLNQIKDSVNRWKAAKNASTIKPLYDALGATESYEEAAVKYGFDAILDVVEKAAESAPKISTPEKVLGLGPVTGFGSDYWEHGLDIDLKIGDPVPSPVSGKVAFVGKNGGFGNQVRITTEDGSSVWLSHLSGFDVNEGDEVVAGQPIGKGGNTGNVYSPGGGDGSHLDLTVVDSTGQFLDPRDIYKILLS